MRGNDSGTKDAAMLGCDGCIEGARAGNAKVVVSTKVDPRIVGGMIQHRENI